MAITKKPEYWVGSEPADLEEYLESYSKNGYSMNEFRLCTCKCGSMEFHLEADPNEGAARRTCVKCQSKHFICDSEEYWADAEPNPFMCLCSSSVANVGVGFALYEDKKDVHWIYIGCRCATCGILGCFADWKIGYGPSLHLMDKA